MFWGLIMEPGRCYTQKVKVSFHVSMAALDISNSNDDPAQVMCVFEGRNYLLCTLNNKDKVQCPLDLNFEAGSKVSFATNGKAHVHLTGYLTQLEDDLFDEEVQEEEVPTKKTKRIKKEVTEGPPSKKVKAIKAEVSDEPEVEEESSDSDFDLNKLEEEDSDDEEVEEEEDDDEEAEEEEDQWEDEEDASSLSNEDSEEEEEETQVKPKQNGLTKPNTLPQKNKNKEQKQPEKVPKNTPKKEPPQKQKKTTLKGGVIVQDLKEGSGDLVKNGQFVHVYYEGRLKDNNKMFDSTTKGPGFSFRVGKGEVIKGWDVGLVGMKVGGKRRITCPPKFAYGSDGSPPVIPPNATLVFDVEVKKVS